ncbi:MAG TPA: hypothetical protein VF326_11665 [Anaerolineaceae bacterium]
MKLLNTVKKFLKKAGMGLTLLVFMAGMVISIPAPAYAAAFTGSPTTATTVAPAASNASNANLTRTFQAEQVRLKTQAGNLDKANAGIARIQGLIDQAKAKSVDTRLLETALSTFKTQLASAQSAHDTAATILAAHTGFNADGSVNDAAIARQTRLDAHQALVNAATSMSQSVKDLSAAVKTWRASTKTTLQGKAMDKAFAAEQARLSQQASNLDKSSAAVDKAQALIDQWQAKGVDVSLLQTLLSTFESQITSARSSHDTASGILASHAGFDVLGKVTAIDQARQTIQETRQALKTAATELGQAFKDLSQGVKTWSSQHKTPNAAPAPTPQPGM